MIATASLFSSTRKNEEKEMIEDIGFLLGRWGNRNRSDSEERPGAKNLTTVEEQHEDVLAP